MPTSCRPKPVGFPAALGCKHVLSHTLRDLGSIEFLMSNSTVFGNIFPSRNLRLLSPIHSFLPPSCALEVLVLTGSEYGCIRTSRFQLICIYDLLQGMVCHVYHIISSINIPEEHPPKTSVKCRWHASGSSPPAITKYMYTRECFST